MLNTNPKHRLIISRYLRLLVLPLFVMFNIACSSGNGTNDSGNNSATVSTSDATVDVVAEISEQAFASQFPAGEINAFGTIVVADDEGEFSDVVASFFRIDRPVARSAIASLYPVNQPRCTVDTNGSAEFRDISASFVPEIVSGGEAISAGETLIVSDVNGSSFTTLFRQGLGEFIFYGVNAAESAPSGPVSQELQALVTGDDFPAFQTRSFPVVAPLEGFNYDTPNNVAAAGFNANSQFRWQASGNPDSMIHLIGSTAGGFFLENGKTLRCLLPDTGNFSFSTATKALLGDEFEGSAPTVSRVSVSTHVEGSATLFMVRETFPD